MNPYFTIKHWLKLGRWRVRRASAAIRWGTDNLSKAPAVLGNAMPKSGSHLIIQVLHGLVPLGPFVDPGLPPINRDEANAKLADEAVLANIQQMRPGDIAYGYINAREPFTSILTTSGRATIFVYRDPRDMIISHVFYATQMNAGHGMHTYYTDVLHTMEERIDAAIKGVEEPGSELSPIQKKYEGYLGWLDAPSVLCLRFEDLIMNLEASLGRFLDYLAERDFTPQVSRSQAIATLQQAIAPSKSGTFRKGKPGNWQEYFTEANKTLFKESTSDLLVRLGYEHNNDW